MQGLPVRGEPAYGNLTHQLGRLGNRNTAVKGGGGEQEGAGHRRDQGGLVWTARFADG